MAVAQPTAGASPKPSRLKSFWDSFSIVFDSRVATVGLIIVLFWFLLGIVSILWTPYPPNSSLFEQNLLPNSVNWLGTDHLGRDIMSRLMAGTQVILLKTRLPDTTAGSLILVLALIPGAACIFYPLVVLKRRFSTRVLLLALVLLVLVGLALLIGSVNIGLIILSLLVYGGIFIYGWLTARRYEYRDTMIVWSGSLALVIALVAISIPLQSVELPAITLPIGVALWGVFGALVVGSFLGLNAAFRGGWWDQSIMQVLDAMVAFPAIVLYLVIITALEQGDVVVIFAITVTGAPGVARLVRSLALDIKTRDYIAAAETRGESPSYIMFREIFPNARGPILVDAMLRVGYAIFAIGTLGFLGIGLPPPDPDWGNMVNEARRFIFVHPWAVIPPAVAIASLVIGLNLFADGMREELTRYQK